MGTSNRCSLCHTSFRPTDIICHSPIYGDHSGVFHEPCMRRVDDIMEAEGTNNIGDIIYGKQLGKPSSVSTTQEKKSMTKDDLVYSILSTCEALHADVAGTSETYTHDDLKQLADWLRLRLQNWKPTAIQKFAIYDQAVFVLASVTLMEWEKHHKDTGNHE